MTPCPYCPTPGGRHHPGCCMLTPLGVHELNVLCACSHTRRAHVRLADACDECECRAFKLPAKR